MKEIQEELPSNVLSLLKDTLDNHSSIAMTDVNGKIIYVNDRACKISKYSKKELIGKNHNKLQSGFHSKLFYQKLWNTITSGRVWKGDIRNLTKDGKVYWMRTVISPRFNEKTEIIGFIAIRTPITDLMKSVEKQIKNRDSETIRKLRDGA